VSVLLSLGWNRYLWGVDGRRGVEPSLGEQRVVDAGAHLVSSQRKPRSKQLKKQGGLDLDRQGG